MWMLGTKLRSSKEEQRVSLRSSPYFLIFSCVSVDMPGHVEVTAQLAAVASLLMP